MDGTPNPVWLGQQSRRWRDAAQGKAAGPAWPESLLRGATVGAGRLLRVQENADATELWLSDLKTPARADLLLRRQHPEAILNASLSPDATFALLLTQSAETVDPRDRCSIELFDLGTRSSRKLSNDASWHFVPAWTGQRTFLFAEISGDSITVFRQNVSGERRPQLTHHSTYPRVVLQPMEPEGWMVVARNDPQSMHVWMTRSPEPDQQDWREIRLVGQRARPMGWVGESMLVVVREDREHSKVILLPPRRDEMPTGPDWLDGKVMVSTGAIEYAFLARSRLLYLGLGAWGHQLMSLDLSSGEVTRIPLEIDPAHGQAFQPIGDGKALLRLQGPFSPPALYTVSASRRRSGPCLEVQPHCRCGVKTSSSMGQTRSEFPAIGPKKMDPCC